VAKAAKKIADEARKADHDLQRFGKRTTEINSTPLEKYAAHMMKLDAALKRNIITQETHARAVRRAAEEYHKAEQGQQSLYSQVGKIDAVGLAWDGVGRALAFVNEGLAYAEARTNRAVDAVTSRLNTTIDLNTIGGPELVKRSNALTKFGLTKAEADAFTIKAQNEGFLEDLEFFASQKAGLGDMTAMGSVAGSFPDMFPGMTARQAVNVVGSAAQYSKLNPSQMAPLMQTAAGGADASGASPEELGAAMSVLSEVMEPGKLATQLQNWNIKQGLNSQLKGRGLIGGLDVLAGWSDEQRHEFLKDDVQTNDLFQKLMKFRAQLPGRSEMLAQAKNATGTAADWTTATTTKNLANAQISKPLQMIAAEEQKKLAEEADLAGRGADRKTARSSYLAGLAARGRAGLAAFFADKAMGVAEHLGGSPGTVTLAGQAGEQAYNAAGGVLAALIERAGKQQAEAATKMSEAADKLSAAAKRIEQTNRGNAGRNAQAEAAIALR
jgi:hypothetical protein